MVTLYNRICINANKYCSFPWKKNKIIFCPIQYFFRIILLLLLHNNKCNASNNTTQYVFMFFFTAYELIQFVLICILFIIFLPKGMCPFIYIVLEKCFAWNDLDLSIARGSGFNFYAKVNLLHFFLQLKKEKAKNIIFYFFVFFFYESKYASPIHPWRHFFHHNPFNFLSFHCFLNNECQTV